MKKNAEQELLEKYKDALINIRSICRDMTRHDTIKLMEIHEMTGLTLDKRNTLLSLSLWLAGWSLLCFVWNGNRK